MSCKEIIENEEQLVNVRDVSEQFHFDDFVGQEGRWGKMKKEQQITPMTKEELLEEIERIQRKREIALKIQVIASSAAMLLNIIWLIILLNS